MTGTAFTRWRSVNNDRPDTARAFYRAIVMPNLKPPVATVEAAIAYRQRILAALPKDDLRSVDDTVSHTGFEPRNRQAGRGV